MLGLLVVGDLIVLTIFVRTGWLRVFSVLFGYIIPRSLLPSSAHCCAPFLSCFLYLKENEAIDDDVGDMVMFMIAGLAIMTLLINGTTCGKLLSYFRMDRATKVCAHTSSCVAGFSRAVVVVVGCTRQTETCVKAFLSSRRLPSLPVSLPQ